jgi:uroporphyrinogen-III synthase
MRALYPRSEIGRDILPELLRRSGVEVVEVVAYRTLPEREVDAGVVARVRRGEADAVVFFSPSSVRNFLDLIRLAQPWPFELPTVCAGATTGRAAREAGLQVVAVSEAPSDASVIDALATWWRGRHEFPREQPASFERELAGRSVE